jgi:hypothetical protein
MHVSFPVAALTHLRPGTNIDILVFHFLLPKKGSSFYKGIAFLAKKQQKMPRTVNDFHAG